MNPNSGRFQVNEDLTGIAPKKQKWSKQWVAEFSQTQCAKNGRFQGNDGLTGIVPKKQKCSKQHPEPPGRQCGPKNQSRTAKKGKLTDGVQRLGFNKRAPLLAGQSQKRLQAKKREQTVVL